MGRLIDADICLHEAWQNFYKQEDEHKKNIDGYDIMRDQFYEQSGFECCQQTIVNAPTVNAIVIPDNATNGDIIKALFPDIEIYDAEKMESIYTGIPFGKYIGANVDCMREWWNVPYKENKDGKID